MKHYNVRERLIDGTIKVIARDGLDKATTKAITQETDLYETYIYQHFENKDGLFAAAFDMLDDELVYAATKCLYIFENPEKDIAQKSREYFLTIWEFLLGNREKCVTFIRYYYSPYFSKYSAPQHVQRYSELTKSFSKSFREEANAWMLLNHMLSSTILFAMRVISKELEDNEDTREHVFRVIYSSISPYFK